MCDSRGTLAVLSDFSVGASAGVVRDYVPTAHASVRGVAATRACMWPPSHH